MVQLHNLDIWKSLSFFISSSLLFKLQNSILQSSKETWPPFPVTVDGIFNLGTLSQKSCVTKPWSRSEFYKPPVNMSSPSNQLQIRRHTYLPVVHHWDVVRVRLSDKPTSNIGVIWPWTCVIIHLLTLSCQTPPECELPLEQRQWFDVKLLGLDHFSGWL